MGADLNNIVKVQTLTDEHVQFLTYQILRGLKYIHSAGIVHRVSVCAPSLFGNVFSQRPSELAMGSEMLLPVPEPGGNM